MEMHFRARQISHIAGSPESVCHVGLDHKREQIAGAFQRLSASCQQFPHVTGAQSIKHHS